ncbi:MAG TPA: dTMP kinase [Planctomycetota bacterium]|jgi:dTMP kinase|nr:dTMP kinase [Planctomycetota bacterium]OQC21221.1 MAG: Thymidylate kinase [Planctomycetes bacterium ADurb.Bin069]HNR99102.1 dTMP kinase [Planctomycetota bacterium]HNU25861.1 dTMP kinase [Planctomycetota bacterium]HOE29759.1 dTMP kinase [Planctomycetota bacterium]
MATTARVPGILIAFEGIDGAGKSTQAALVADRLADTKTRALLVREPGATPVAEAVRRLLLERGKNAPGREAEMFLYLAARADLYRRVILPALDRGRFVLSDRCFWSTVAYQGRGLGLGVAKARALSLIATGGREPDLVVLLDLAPEEAAARRRGKADRIEARGSRYLAEVRAEFLALARRARGKAMVVNAHLPADTICLKILARLRALMRRRRRATPRRSPA